MASTRRGTRASPPAVRPAELHGAMTYLLQSDEGQIHEAWSISAGLDYPGVGPEHALLHDLKRVRYEGVTDKEAVAALQALCRHEGIIPALSKVRTPSPSPSAKRPSARKPRTSSSASGRGDKDPTTLSDILRKE